MNNYLNELAKEIGEVKAQQVDELSAAFMMKNKIVNPNKVVLIQHIDFSTGKVYSWFEKTRGRSRKEVLTNVGAN